MGVVRASRDGIQDFFPQVRETLVQNQTFVQVLLVNANHWVTVGKMGAARRSDSVHVYDCMLPTDVDMKIKLQVCSLLKTLCPALTFHKIGAAGFHKIGAAGGSEVT